MDLTTQLKDILSRYWSSERNSEEEICILFQRQPPILGVNSEKAMDVLMYSEFVGILQYELQQFCQCWPEEVFLSQIA